MTAPIRPPSTFAPRFNPAWIQPWMSAKQIEWVNQGWIEEHKAYEEKWRAWRALPLRQRIKIRFQAWRAK